MGIIDPVQHKSQDDLDRELEQIQGNKEAPVVPEKYQGKSLEDVIKMHQEAEKEKSRLGNELGQARQQLQHRPVKEEEPKKREVKVDDLLENPEEAVSTIVNQDPVVRNVRTKVEQLEQDLNKRSFEQSYPEYQKDLADPAFAEWINGSTVRRALAVAADKYDFTAAGELWNLWEERKQLVKDVEAKKEEQKKQDRATKLKQGMLESGTGSSTETKKVFSREEIRNLKTRALQGDRKAQAIVSDPVWQRETLQAYVDKRTK